MRYILSIVVSLTVAATLGLYTAGTPSAQSTTLSKHEPPDGTVLSGVDADQQREDTAEDAQRKWDEWTELMGGRPANISHTFEGFNAWFAYDLDIAKARGATPLITWQTGETSPKTIANAGKTSGGKSTDKEILENAKLSADYGGPVFLRIDQEMNAHWFPYGAYNKDGSQRSFSAEDFQDMWRRMVVIFRGGTVADINGRLEELGLPPLDAEASFPEWMGLPSTSDPEGYFEPAENVAFVFNPVDAPGIPDVEGNRWLDYYPGDEYVDWVGLTTYNGTWNASMKQRFGWLEDFYEEFSAKRGKPYMFGEWGLEPKENAGFGDNPSYVNEMLRWAHEHPKVKAMVYFSAQDPKGDYRLSSYPESAKALASYMGPEGYLKKPSTTLTLTASPTLVDYNGTATLSGKLSASSGSLPDETVSLWRSTNGGATWTYDGTATYDASSGTYKVSRSLKENTNFQLRFSGDESQTSSTSPNVRVKAYAYLSKPWNAPSVPTTNAYFTIEGYLKPYHSGYTRLYFYRYDPEADTWDYHAYADAPNSKFYGYTKYSLSYKLPYAGWWRVQAYHSDKSHQTTWSPPKDFIVE